MSNTTKTLRKKSKSKSQYFSDFSFDKKNIITDPLTIQSQNKSNIYIYAVPESGASTLAISLIDSESNLLTFCKEKTTVYEGKTNSYCKFYLGGYDSKKIEKFIKKISKDDIIKPSYIIFDRVFENSNQIKTFLKDSTIKKLRKDGDMPLNYIFIESYSDKTPEPVLLDFFNFDYIFFNARYSTSDLVNSAFKDLSSGKKSKKLLKFPGNFILADNSQKKYQFVITNSNYKSGLQIKENDSKSVDESLQETPFLDDIVQSDNSKVLKKRKENKAIVENESFFALCNKFFTPEIIGKAQKVIDLSLDFLINYLQNK